MEIKAKVMSAGKLIDVTISRKRNLMGECYLVHFPNGNSQWMPVDEVVLDKQGQKDARFLLRWNGK